MGVLECASVLSVWRGYEYFKKNRVRGLKQLDENVFSATVQGSASTPYSVELHMDHPRKSICDCPHANGRRVVCKHIVAVYFTILPEEAEKYFDLSHIIRSGRRGRAWRGAAVSSIAKI